MTAFEKLLAPGSTELPDCRCGTEMHLFRVKPFGDTEIRIFRCDACHHEFQLMVWSTPERQKREPAWRNIWSGSKETVVKVSSNFRNEIGHFYRCRLSPKKAWLAAADGRFGILALTIRMNWSVWRGLSGANDKSSSMHKTPSQIARALRRLRNAQRIGLLRGVFILPGRGACEAAKEQVNAIYSADKFPSLPLPRCTCDICDCKYRPIGSDKLRRLNVTSE